MTYLILYTFSFSFSLLSNTTLAPLLAYLLQQKLICFLYYSLRPRKNRLGMHFLCVPSQSSTFFSIHYLANL